MQNAQKSSNTLDQHHTPVIGVLCIDVAQKLLDIYGDKIKSYIPASYVKFLESAGAKIVPIWIGREKFYYEEIMNNINGVLIPGGAVFVDIKSIIDSALGNDCVTSSKIIYDIAKRKNSEGEYFPIWGTCLGSQLLVIHSIDATGQHTISDPRQKCKKMKVSLPVKFEDEFRQSKLFENLPKELERIMSEQPFGYHVHAFCFTRDGLANLKILDQWKILATNSDSDGLEFISIMEHTKYPFFSCIFHSERNCFENTEPNDPCDHSPTCINAAQYFANFFVSCCRRNKNRFASIDKEMLHMIWNFPTFYTGIYGAHWTQCYLFERTSDYPKERRIQSSLSSI